MFFRVSGGRQKTKPGPRIDAPEPRGKMNSPPAQNQPLAGWYGSKRITHITLFKSNPAAVFVRLISLYNKKIEQIGLKTNRLRRYKMKKKDAWIREIRLAFAVLLESQGMGISPG